MAVYRARKCKVSELENGVPQETHVERNLSKDLLDQSRVIFVRSLKKMCTHTVITCDDVVITQSTTLISVC